MFSAKIHPLSSYTGESSISLSLNRGCSLPYDLGQVGCLLGGRGLSLLGSAWSWRIGFVLRAIGNMCGGGDVNIVVPLYTKL